jgi:carbonic anhydrase
MDARIVPAEAFGVKEGEAHVIRNAGGRAPEALRSLIISQQLLGTQEIALIQHTDCGMLVSSLGNTLKEVGKVRLIPISLSARLSPLLKPEKSSQRA